MEVFLKHRIVRGAPDSADIKDLSYQILLTEYEPDVNHFRLEFEKPLMVSRGAKPDYLEITIKDPSIFLSDETGLLVRKNTIMKKNIP